MTLAQHQQTMIQTLAVPIHQIHMFTNEIVIIQHVALEGNKLIIIQLYHCLDFTFRCFQFRFFTPPGSAGTKDTSTGLRECPFDFVVRHTFFLSDAHRIFFIILGFVHRIISVGEGTVVQIEHQVKVIIVDVHI